MRREVAWAVGLLASGCGVASADLDGTELEQFTFHTGQFGRMIGGTYTYGTLETYFDSFNFSYDVSSPGEVPGYDNSIQYDFTNFAYADFAGETGTVTMEDIAEKVEPGSVIIVGADMATEIGFNYTDDGNSLEADWDVDSLLALGNSMFVAWNSVGGGCPPDCNGDGELNVLDFVCFQQEFQMMTDYADCNGDGEYSILDFVCFQQLFQQGCP